MFEFIILGIATIVLVPLIYDYSKEKLDQNTKTPFNIKYDIK